MTPNSEENNLRQSFPNHLTFLYMSSKHTSMTQFNNECKYLEKLFYYINTQTLTPVQTDNDIHTHVSHHTIPNANVSYRVTLC